jgi:hypothetical protein
MSNTITNIYIQKLANRICKYITIASDGTNETATILYDSSDANTIDSLDSTIIEVTGCIGAASTARVSLLWDATTDVLALDLPINIPFKFNYLKIGGLPNQGGSGKTGDILITTTGLASGDKIHLTLTVRPD